MQVEFLKSQTVFQKKPVLKSTTQVTFEKLYLHEREEGAQRRLRELQQPERREQSPCRHADGNFQRF